MIETGSRLEALLDEIANEALLADAPDAPGLDAAAAGVESLREKFDILALLDEGGGARGIASRAKTLAAALARIRETGSEGFEKAMGAWQEALRDLQREVYAHLEAPGARGPALSGGAAPGSDEGEEDTEAPGAVRVGVAPSGAPPATEREVFAEFSSEAAEHLDRAEMILLDMEAGRADAEAVNELFRGVHSIKGMAGFLALGAVAELSHSLESLLDLLRSGAAADAHTLDVLFRGVDLLKRLVAAQERAPGAAPENPSEVETLVARIDRRTRRVAESRTGAAPTGPAAGGEDGAAEADEAATGEPAPGEAPGRRDGGRTRSVRVKVERIDDLVNMVGELVITFQQVAERSAAVGDATLGKSVGQTRRIVSVLQETALSLRMVPVNSVFQRLVRQARDLARSLGKEVRVETSGEATEIDRNLIEEIQDPLIHIVRNSVDHGLETPAEREAEGKPREGRITIAARHQSGMVVVEVADDGRGLDRDRIVARAREMGLLGPGDDPAGNDAYAFIFAPGFSTAERVSDVSGRGVGMDVVRRNIERARGKVDVETKRGSGTTIRIRLPLTLAIIDGMVVRAGGERFVLPTVSIAESLRPAERDCHRLAEGGEVVMVRGSPMPLLRLARAFGLSPEREEPWESLVVVVQSADRRYALQVDDLLGKQEVVIKALGRALASAEGVTGGAILGDGRVGLILDPDGLFGMTGRTAPTATSKQNLVRR